MSNSLHTGRTLGIIRNIREKIKATLLGGTFNHTLNQRQCPTVEEELDSQSLGQTATLVLPRDLVTYLNSQGLLGYLISKTVVLNWGQFYPLGTFNNSRHISFVATGGLGEECYWHPVGRASVVAEHLTRHLATPTHPQQSYLAHAEKICSRIKQNQMTNTQDSIIFWWFL